MERNDRTFTITLSGRLADAGPLDIDVIFPVVSDFRAALREMIRHLWGVDADAGRPGRPSDALRAASALKLVSVDHGSYAMTIEIADARAASGGPFTRQDWPAGATPDAPLAALNALLTGAATDPDELPDKVSGHLYKMQSRLPEGIDAVRVSDNAAMAAFTIERRPRRRRQTPRRQITQYGRLQAIDRIRRSAELHSLSGVTRLNFPESLDDAMLAAARKYVAVTGSGVAEANGPAAHIKVASVTPLDQGLNASGMPTDAELSRAANSSPFDFEHPDWVQDEVLHNWVENILNRKDRDL